MKLPLASLTLPIAVIRVYESRPQWREVTAELLNFDRHWPYTFAVHRHWAWPACEASDAWVVSNVETGLRVARGRSREDAVKAAICRLWPMSTAYVHELVMAAPKECRK